MAETATETLMERHRQEALARRDELQPMVDEFNQLEDYLGSFSGGPRRRATSRSSGSGTTRRRRVNGPNRAQQFLSVVEKTPGATIAQIAEEINGNLSQGDKKVSSNYLYRVRDGLMEGGQIAEEGDGFRATGKKLDE